MEDELVERVIEVTGASDAEARHLLAACNSNVEAAVALFFEQGGESNGDAIAAAVASAPAEEADVRAPIAPVREQLIGPEDDNFYGSAATTSGRMARTTQLVKVKVCPLRDFAREGAVMEQQLQAATETDDPDVGSGLASTSENSSIRRRRRARAAAMVSTAVSQPPKVASSRLGDLFRPPVDIAYAGTFQAARMCATARKHWLLVNVQSDNFDSQLLNRDVWSDRELRKLLSRQFLLWQVDADSSEGRRFVAFYHCAKLPYVCIIDPRTGEEVWKSGEPKQVNVLPDLKQFLHKHNDFSKELADDMPSTSTKRPAEYITVVDTDDDEREQGASCSTNTGDGASTSGPKKRTRLLELSEEEQLALAIRNSMRENGNQASKDSPRKRAALIHDDDGSDSDSIEEFGEEEIKGPCERTSYEERLGAAKDELTTLKLRLLNKEGVDEMVQLRWPSDTLLHVLRLYIAQRHAHIPTEGYKLICAFPRKTLEAMDDSSTLKALGLHPSANLHVTLDD